MKDIVIGFIAVLALVAGGSALLTMPSETVVDSQEPRNQQTFGAAGPVQNELVEFFAGFVTKDSYATTTPASATLTARETAGFSTVSLFPSVGDVTMTTAASTTLGALLGREGGAMKRVCYENATTTSGIDITFAAGTGVDMEVASSTATSGQGNAGSLIILSGASACIEYQKKSGTLGANMNDITARFTRYVDGD